MRKAGIHDLTVQSSQLQIFEGKSVKGKGNEKSRNLRLRSYHPKFIFWYFLQLFEKENLKGKNKLEGFEKERKKNTF